MTSATFVIFDADYKVRNTLARVLSRRGYVIQVDHVEEFGQSYRGKAIAFISDVEGKAAEVSYALQKSGVFFPIVAYSPSPSLARVVHYLSGPCAGYLQWPGDEGEVWKTLEVLTETAAEQVRRRVREARARHKMAQLTPRERQVAMGIGTGLSSKELARPLGISFRTVELHRANIMMKLEMPNMASLIRTVVEAGESTDPELELMDLDSGEFHATA